MYLTAAHPVSNSLVQQANPDRPPRRPGNDGLGYRPFFFFSQKKRSKKKRLLLALPKRSKRLGCSLLGKFRSGFLRTIILLQNPNRSDKIDLSYFREVHECTRTMTSRGSTLMECCKLISTRMRPGTDSTASRGDARPRMRNGATIARPIMLA